MPGEPYHHGDLKEALVEAALRVLGAESADAVTLRRLAREAGVSHAAPYHHFADLDALLAAVAARGFEMLRAEMAGSAAGAPAEPWRRLQAAGTAYVTFAVVHPELFRLMFGGRWRDTTRHPGLREAERRAYEALEELIAGATGRSRNDADMLPAVRAAWCLVHGIAMLVMDGRIDLPMGAGAVAAAEQLTRELTTVLGRGLEGPFIRGGSPRSEKAGPRASPGSSRTRRR